MVGLTSISTIRLYGRGIIRLNSVDQPFSIWKLMLLQTVKFDYENLPDNWSLLLLPNKRNFVHKTWSMTDLNIHESSLKLTTEQMQACLNILPWSKFKILRHIWLEGREGKQTMGKVKDRKGRENEIRLDEEKTKEAWERGTRKKIMLARCRRLTTMLTAAAWRAYWPAVDAGCSFTPCWQTMKHRSTDLLFKSVCLSLPTGWRRGHLYSIGYQTG